jgi:hypothetical protein
MSFARPGQVRRTQKQKKKTEPRSKIFFSSYYLSLSEISIVKTTGLPQEQIEAAP